MTKDFNIEISRTPDIGKLSVFYGGEYPAGEVTSPEFLEWEYVQNPFGNAVISLAMDESQIASQYALIPIRIMLHGSRISGSLSLNTLTDSRYRGVGLFAWTAEAAFQYCTANGIAFTSGIPNQNSFPGFTGRLRFKLAGDLSFLAKPLRPLKIAGSLIRRRRIKKGAELAVHIDESALQKKSITIFREGTAWPAYESFHQAWTQGHDLSIDRSQAYLKWRYLDHPLRKYHLFAVLEGNAMKALLVTRCLHVFGIRTCVIMDFRSLDARSGKLLLKGISAEMKRNHIDMLAAVSSGAGAEHRQLKDAGFYVVPRRLLPQRLPFIYRGHIPFEGSAQLAELSNWHFTFGDYDIF